MSGEYDIIDPGSGMEDQGKEDKDTAANVRVGQTERLIRNLSRLLLAFGFAIGLGMGVVWAKAYEWVRADILLTTLGILIGAFMVAAAVVVSASYGISFRKLLLGRFFPHPGVLFRTKSEDEVLAGMPRAYLALSGIVMLVCSGVMIVGDIFIRNIPGYKKVSLYNDKGDNFYYVCSTFVAAACMSFALAMLTSKKPLKILVACFFLSSLAGLLASSYLFLRFGWGLYRFNRMTSIGLMEKALQGSYIKGQDYPSVSVWPILKFMAAEIIMTFSFFNVFLAATFFVCFKATIKRSSSRLLGFLGIILISTGIGLEFVLDLLITNNIMNSGYSPSLQSIRSKVAISTLLAGIHALHGFYSASNLRKFTLFFLSLIVITSGVFAGIAVLKFRSEAMEVEAAAAMTPCQLGNLDDLDAQFCVYNISEAYRQNYNYGCVTTLTSRWCKRCLSDVNEKSPPPLACVPKDKLCDGRADLFMDKVDRRYYSSPFSKSRYDLTL